MEKKYTASEVRDQARFLDGLSRQMLNRFADRLEADEKAEPVAEMTEGGLTWYQQFSPQRNAGTKFYTHPAPADADWKNNVLAGDMKAIVDGDGNVLYVNKAIFDLQVHKTEDALATVSALTADAERLAEALRKIVEWQPPSVTGRNGEQSPMGVEFGSNGVRDYFRRIAQETLAAHSAQAQPPAAQENK